MCMVASMNTTTFSKPDRTKSKSALKTAGMFLIFSGFTALGCLFMAGNSFQFVWSIVAVLQLMCSALSFKSFRINRELEDIAARKSADVELHDSWR